MQEILDTIVKDKIFDDFLVEHFINMSREMGFSEMSVKISEERFNNNPKDQGAALQLFDTYIETSNFMKMNAISMKIAMQFGLTQFTVHNIESLYLLSQAEGSLPNTIDLAYMFAKKYIDKFKPEDKIKPCDGKLYIKILKKKGLTEDAITFLNSHPEIFPIDLERSREKCNIYSNEIERLKNSDKHDDLVEAQKKHICEIRDIIKANYEKPQEFNCIYDLYEEIIRSLVDVVKEEVPQHDLIIMNKEVEESEAKESELFEIVQEGKFNIESVKNLWRSLVFYHDFELDTNKSTEAHNLRKASILATLFLMHRLKLAGINYDTENPSKNVFSELCVIYSRRYLQLSSVVYDLKGYFPYLTIEFLKPLEDEIDSFVADDAEYKAQKIRFFRKKSTILKMKKMLGFFDKFTSIEFVQSEELKAIISDYFECLGLEEAPEKGERRTSDDFIFVTEEIFRDSVTDSDPSALNGVKLLRIALLEYCLSQSIYNFDIALQLTKLYQELNMNDKFAEKLRYLELKGIQMESLGYVAIRQFLVNNDYDFLTYWFSKFQVFLKRNAKDLRNLKCKAMLGDKMAAEKGLNEESNYEKVDEFFSYEDYLNKSLFLQISKFFKSIYLFREKITNDNWIDEFMNGLASKSYEFLEDKYNDICEESMSKQFTRTQDLGVWISKYSTIPKYTEVATKWRNCSFYTKDKNDPIFGPIKFTDKCNYKPGLMNSLCIFEHPLMFQIYKGLCLTSAKLNCRKPELFGDIQKITDSISTKIEIFSKVFEENKDQNDYKHDIIIINQSFEMFKAWHSVNLLCVKLNSLKDLKSDQGKLNEAIQANEEFIKQQISNITQALNNDTLWNGEKIEEVKLDYQDLSGINKIYRSCFAYTNEGSKLINFLSNYVLPMFSVSFSNLSQYASSLTQKKKKKTGSEVAFTTILIQPLKEVIKTYKDWLNSKATLYSSDSQSAEPSSVLNYKSFIEQVAEHCTIYLSPLAPSIPNPPVPPVPTANPVLQSVKNYVKSISF